jgi:DNA-3-methyladenine glycosylase I
MILRKREAFRRAFEGWDTERIAAFGDADVERLLGDPGVVRHRGKIEAAIANARAVRALEAGGGSLPELLWSFAPEAEREPDPAALAKRLRALGFHFVGPTTVHSWMQAAGVVNDHLPGCAFR